MTAKSRSKSIADALAGALGAILIGAAVYADAQTQPPPPAPPQSRPPAQPVTPPAAPTPVAPPVVVPPDYIIGPDDVLSIVYWRDKDMTAEVAVRPDGKISLPLVNDVQAAGLTPTQLRDSLVTESKKYIEDPNVTVVVKQINSRRVFITGEISKPGTYVLSGPTTVLQLIALAGGVRDYADTKKIQIIRNENGKPVSHLFNYKDVMQGKNLQQNIELKPGDTVIIP
jgi:polysaccharide export outer membrane protein